VLKIVLDTSVVVAGLRTRLGAGNAVLRLVAERRIKLLATPPLFLEYEDVLKRPEHRLAHGLTPLEIDEFLAELAAVIEPVEVADFAEAGQRFEISVLRPAELLRKVKP